MTSAPAGAASIALRELTKSYGAVRVVDGVDLDVPAGQLVALLGPSGCGKTTTLRMVAGLLPPTAGDVAFDGRSVVRLPAERRPVAMVFQKSLLFPNMTVAANVGFGLRMRRVKRADVRARVAEMLDLVQLPGYEDRRVGELSGGQEQRVSLARALVVGPQVLLLDEPLSQLDAGLRVDMRDLVRRVQREVGVTTVFVTHDQEEAVALADGVALMLDGRIEQYAAPRELYERPATVRVARFFGGRNFFAGTVVGGIWRGALGEVPVPGAPDGPGTLTIRPEAVRLGAQGIPAIVRSGDYRGTHIRLAADAGGTEVCIVVPPTGAPALGERVCLELPPASCTVLRG